MRADKRFFAACGTATPAGGPFYPLGCSQHPPPQADTSADTDRNERQAGGDAPKSLTEAFDLRRRAVFHPLAFVVH